jgi:LysM repeat protein
VRADWRRYAAPAAFLLAVTVAIVFVRSGLQSGNASSDSAATVPTITRKHVVSTTTTKAHTKTSSASARFWTVRAGDTYGVISSQSGVPVATIEQLNPKVSSTALFIGEKIRLR